MAIKVIESFLSSNSGAEFHNFLGLSNFLLRTKDASQQAGSVFILVG